MIGQGILRKNVAAQARFGALTQANTRGFAGGGNKPKAIDPKTTDYDIIFVGKHPHHPLAPSLTPFSLHSRLTAMLRGY